MKFDSIYKHISGFKAGIIWFLVNELVSHFPSKHIRLLCLKILGLKINGDVRFFIGFHIRKPSGIIIKNGVTIGPNVLLDGRKGLTIEENAVIAYDAIIWTLNHDYNSSDFAGKGAPVKIGKYAWVCCRSIILPGVKVGDYAIVASGAIVTKDVPDYAIVGGVPAKVIGYRNKGVNYNYGYSKEQDYSHLL